MRHATILLISCLLITPTFAQLELRPSVKMGPIPVAVETERYELAPLTSASAIPPIVQQRCQSVAMVHATVSGGGQRGSATHLGAGIWLTNRHVIDGGRSFAVHLKSGQKLAASLAGVSRGEADLAVLQTTDPRLPPVPISVSRPQLGATVYPSGFDHGELSRHKCFAARVVDSLGSSMISKGFGRRSGSISGNSGGPVFTAAGELVAPLYGNTSAQGTQDGSGTVLSVSWSQTRQFLLPWRAKIMAALSQCGPQGCQPPMQIGGMPDPYSQTIPPPGQAPIFQPQQPQPQQQFGWSAPPKLPRDRIERLIAELEGYLHIRDSPVDGESIDYDKLAAVLLPELAKDPRFRGPAGEPGRNGQNGQAGAPGANGTVTAEHLAAITKAVLQSIESDDRFRGPPGRDAVVDANVIRQIVAAMPGRRVVLVEGGRTIDDETYAPDEPIVLDIRRILATQ